MSTGLDQLPEERRKEIFEALVTSQDQGVSVAQSRKDIAAKYQVSPADLASIEREGMDQEWPPL